MTTSWSFYWLEIKKIYPKPTLSYEIIKGSQNAYFLTLPTGIKSGQLAK